MTKEIELLKQEIKMLQSKLEFLEEIETHKSQPKMHLENTVEGEIVSYNDEIYYRLEYPTAVIWYKRKGNIAVNASGVKLVCVTDLETHRLLEGLWFNEVKHGKYPDEVECPDEPEYYDEVEWDEKDNPKPMDDVVERLIKEHQAKKLWNILSNKYDYVSATCDDIVSAVEEWLPKEQNADGSQNVDTELLVDGFNHAIQKMKEMLR